MTLANPSPRPWWTTALKVAIVYILVAGLWITFSDQLLAGPVSQGGDSGSAVLDGNNRLIGLLFAGSESTTIINRIEHVFSGLGLTL